MSIFGEFKAFISKGNVMDLAVGVIIGGAFQGIVTSLVKDVITPAIALVSATLFHTKGPPSFASWAYGGIMIGNFLNSVVAFLILAAVVFFFLVKPMNRLMAAVSPPPGAPVVPEEIQLLRQIRDSLKTATVNPPSQAQP